MRGQLRGNGDLYVSHLNLPQLELGLQSSAKSWYFELGGQAGPVLAGYYKPGDWTRRLGPSASWGARGTLGLELLLVDAEWIRVRAAELLPRTPVDMFLTLLCVQLSRPGPGLCLEARHYRGEAALGPDEIDLRRSTALALLFGGPFPCPDPIPSAE